MQAPFDNIVQHLFHQPSLMSVTVDELQRMAQQHPCFAAAHFLLLKKMQDTDHPQFNTQLHKTTLYFNNPLWLQFLLQPETVAHFKVSDTAPFISNDSAVVQEENEINHAPAPFEAHDELLPGSNNADNGLQNEAPAPEPADAHLFQPAAAQVQAGGIMDVITAVFNDREELPAATSVSDQTAVSPEIFSEQAAAPAEITAIAPEENIAATDNEAGIPAEIAAGDADLHTGVLHENAPLNEKQERVHENAGWVVEEKKVSEEVAAIPQYDNQVSADATDSGHIIPAEVQEPVLPENNNELIQQGVADLPVAESAVINEITSPIQASTEENIQPEAPVAEKVNFEKNDNSVEPDAAPILQEARPESNNNEKPLFKTIIETPAAKNDMLFEPYHTVDYFASQGIKLSKIEADSKDKLGRQLKSFTEWLKSMKKLPQVSIDKILSENEESKVVEDAIHSIESKEVITEAMAEVFEKQGMHEKAAEVYRKLSLLNPAKSAYFAAKIDLLKH